MTQKPPRKETAVTQPASGHRPLCRLFGALSSTRLARFFTERESRVSTRASLRRSESRRLRTVRALTVRRQNPLFRPLDLLRHTLFMTEFRAFAALLLPLGLSATFRCLILPLLTDDFPLLLPDGIAGLLALLLSLFLLPFRAPMCRTVTSEGFLSRLFFDSLSLPRPYPTEAHGIPAWLLLFPGLGLGVAAAFVSPLALFGGFLALVFLILSLASPEFSLILSVVIVPFLPLLPHTTLLVLLAVCPGALAYLFKLLFAKRELIFRPLDLFVLLFSLCFLVFALRAEPAGGLLLDGFLAALLAIVGYILAANLLTAGRTLHLFTDALLVLATLLSLLGIYRSLTALIAPAWRTSRTALLFGEAIDTLLGEPHSLAALLLLVLPLAFARAEAKKLSPWRAAPSLLLPLAALALTLEATALLALGAALILLSLLKAHRPVRFYPALCLLGALVLFLLPSAAHTAIVNTLALLGEAPAAGAAALFSAWHEALSLLLAHPLGLRPEAVGQAAALPLGIALYFGIPGLILFLLLTVYLWRTALASRTLAAANRHRPFAHAASASLLGLLLFGFTAPVLEHRSTLYLFFLMLGVLAASVRGAHTEELGTRRGKAGKVADTATAEVRLRRTRGRG